MTSPDETGVLSNAQVTSKPTHKLGKNIHQISTLAEVHSTLTRLSAREAAITSRLDALLNTHHDLVRQLHRLDLLRAHLASHAQNARSIAQSSLAPAASTAARLSSAVATLDTEQAAVRATLRVVEQVVELRACVLGVVGCMGAPQDWEGAASYLQRARKIPDEVIRGAFAEMMVPTAEVPDSPSVTLDGAAESLCALFLKEFERAAASGDGSKVTRFFKLFPMIGRVDTGLEAYGRYVCHGVAARARNNLREGSGRREGLFYANILTRLFEHVAQIVDGHEPLVERHYGAGMMIKVIERLQVEADVQGGLVLDTWGDERSIEKKLTEVKSYAFSFLVQSFLSAPRGVGGTPRSMSPAVRDGSNGTQSQEDEGVDMKEVDGLLNEIAVMLGRWALYTRFLASKVTQPEDDASLSNYKGLTLPTFLANSTLNRKIVKGLIEPFNVMTTFYFRRSVEKSFQLDEPPPNLSLNPSKDIGNPPFITSAVDDVMYIVSQVLHRSLSTSQRSVISSVVPAIDRVLGSDFVGMTQRKMRDECYPKAAIQGGLPPEDKIIQFLVLINNLDVATDYVQRIVRSKLDSGSSATKHNSNTDGDTTTHPVLTDLFPFNNDATFVEISLKSLQSSFENKAGELVAEAISVTFNQVMKPRIRPILAEAFRDTNYNLSAEDLAEMKREREGDTAGGDDDVLNDESVKQRFTRGWVALSKPLRRILTDKNGDRLITTAVQHLSRALEKRIWSYYGRINELGAVRMERDIAGIVSATVQGARYGLRDSFSRCLQITLVMNMEEDEWDEMIQAKDDGQDEEEGTVWYLDMEERKRARAMVKDKG
ncbi:MAG: hypothetical protein M1822_004108 [Bathelium mastoideum]|nr:MAG: hypothetical protein M1822_004108 [Bathelium mastoideum]